MDLQYGPEGKGIQMRSGPEAPDFDFNVDSMCALAQFFSLSTFVENFVPIVQENKPSTPPPPSQKTLLTITQMLGVVAATLTVL